MRTEAQRRGGAAEDAVAAGLEVAGWRVLARNIRVGRDEIDLLAVDPGPPQALVVIEVRLRGRRDFGLPEETLDWRKRRALRRALGTLRGSRLLADGTPVPRLPWRVDLVAVEPDGDGYRFRHHRSVGL